MIRLMHYRAYKRASKWYNHGELEDGFVVFKIKPSELLDGFTEILAGEYLACPLSSFHEYRDIQNVAFEEVTFYTRKKDGDEFSSFRATDI